jgi:hypothetical protein
VEEKEETVTELVEEVNELPSFKIETPDEEDYVPITKVELTETISRRFEEQSSANKQRNLRTFAIAATILITIGVGAGIFMLQTTEKKPALATRQPANSQQKAAIAKPKLPVISESARRQQEQKLKQEAEKRHNSLLEEWKKKISALEAKIGSTTNETVNDSQAVNIQESTNPQAGE